VGCSALQCVAVRCSALQCTLVDATCYRVLQCVAAYFGGCYIFQFVAVCCSVLQCVAVCCSVVQGVAVFGSVLQYVTMCLRGCFVLQRPD